MPKIRWHKDKFLPRDDCQECSWGDRRSWHRDPVAFKYTTKGVVCQYECHNGHTWSSGYSGNYRGRYPYPYLELPQAKSPGSQWFTIKALP